MSFTPSPNQCYVHAKNLLPVVVVVVIAFVIFYPTLTFELLWDDVVYLLATPAYWDWKRIPNFFFEPFYLYPGYYRPLVLATFSLYPPLDSEGLTAQRVTQIVIHCINAGLIYQLATHYSRHLIEAQAPPDKEESKFFLLQQRHVATGLIAGSIYVAHPAMVEPVAWLSGRFDLLMTTFLLLALYTDARITQPIARASLVAFFFLLAFFSKEAAFIFPLVLFLFHFAQHLTEPGIKLREAATRTVRRYLYTYVALTLAATVYFFFRAIALDHVYVDAGQPILDRLLLAAYSNFLYLAIIFLPWLTSEPVQPFDFDQVFTLQVIGGAFISLIVAALAIYLWIIRRRNTLFPLIGAMVALVPTLHLFSYMQGHSIVADRFLAFPLALMLSTVGITPMARLLFVNRFSGANAPRGAVDHPSQRAFSVRRYGIALTIALWFIASAAFSSASTSLWRNDLTLWRYVVERHPNRPFAHSLLGNAYLRAGNVDAAEAHLAYAFSLRPTVIDAINLATCMLIRKDFFAARLQLGLVHADTLSQQNKETQAHFWRTLAIVETELGNWELGRAHFERALSLDEQLWLTRFQYAQALLARGEQTYARFLATKKPTLSEMKKLLPENALITRLAQQLND